MTAMVTDESVALFAGCYHRGFRRFRRESAAACGNFGMCFNVFVKATQSTGSRITFTTIWGNVISSRALLRSAMAKIAGQLLTLEALR